MRLLDKNNLGPDEDWYGNNAAVRCYACGKVFLTSHILHRKGRACPACGQCRVLFTKTGVEVSEASDAVGLVIVRSCVTSETRCGDSP